MLTTSQFIKDLVCNIVCLVAELSNNQILIALVTGTTCCVPVVTDIFRASFHQIYCQYRCAVASPAWMKSIRFPVAGETGVIAR